MPTKNHKREQEPKGEDPSINWASGKRQNGITKNGIEVSIPEISKGTKEGRSSKAHNI